MQDPAEHRQHPRYPCDREFEGSFPEGTAKGRAGFPCHAINASTGGLMLETRDALAIGQRIRLSLQTRDSLRSIVAEAEVVWTQPYGEVHRSGVRFLSRHEDFAV